MLSPKHFPFGDVVFGRHRGRPMSFHQGASMLLLRTELVYDKAVSPCRRRGGSRAGTYSCLFAHTARVRSMLATRCCRWFVCCSPGTAQVVKRLRFPLRRVWFLAKDGTHPSCRCAGATRWVSCFCGIGMFRQCFPPATSHCCIGWRCGLPAGPAKQRRLECVEKSSV